MGTIGKVLDCRKGRSTASNIFLSSDNRNISADIIINTTARRTSNFPCGYLLFANLNSNVPSYADEFKLTKYNFPFQSLSACR